MEGPSAEVLDLFAVPDDVRSLPGGQGRSVLAGDLVLSPGRDAAVAEWLSPVLARLAVGLDERPDRGPRDVRVAVPVPARDGSWVVDGWAATRWEPGSTTCRDLDTTLAAGRLLHARLASLVREPPAPLLGRTDRWAVAERVAFGPASAWPAGAVLDRVAGACEEVDLGPDQLVHADLAGNVLLDPRGAPVVIDVAPAWRPARWAEAVCVLDSVVGSDAPRGALERWRHDADRQALLRAVAFRVLGDGRGVDEARYAEVLDALAVGPPG